MVYIPLNPDKTPAIAGWNKPEYRGIHEGEQPPFDSWVGLRADNFVIVDCDTKAAKNYWIGLAQGRAITYVVKTPRGWHFYYRWTPGSPTGPAVGVWEGIDIRAGNGSYVVSRYAPGYRLLHEGDLIDFDPAWLPAKVEKDTGSGEGWTKVPEGKRNDTLAAFAGTMRARGMDAGEIGKTLYALNKAYCDPPLPQDEVLTIARSVGRYEPQSQTEIELTEAAPEGLWGNELQDFEAPPLRWIVEDVIPEGLTILAGKPKVGKSWMSLGLAAAVAEGSGYLDREVPKGKALYLALEDNFPRLQRRMAKVQAGLPFPADLRFEISWPSEPVACSQIHSWMQRHPDTKLVIVDTLAKIRHEASDRQRGTYQDDYQALSGLKQVADKYGIAVVVVHHLRKSDAEDSLDEVSGTTGLTGAADTILVLKQDTLQGRGRDLEEDLDLDVTFERDTCRWRLLGAGDVTVIFDLDDWLLSGVHKNGDVVDFDKALKTRYWLHEELSRQWSDLIKAGHWALRPIRPGDPLSPIVVSK